MEPTVYIVDDDPAMLDSLCELVHGMGMTPVAFPDAREFLTHFDSSRPGCLVLDLRLPGLSGLDLQRQLATRHDAPPVVIITGHGDLSSGIQAMKLGVVDFLEKPCSPKQIRLSILEALEKDNCRRQADARREESAQRIAHLTADERQVADLIAQGHTNQEIAARLDISLRTVQFRRSSIFRKLEIKSRAELVRLLLTP